MKTPKFLLPIRVDARAENFAGVNHSPTIHIYLFGMLIFKYRRAEGYNEAVNRWRKEK